MQAAGRPRTCPATDSTGTTPPVRAASALDRMLPVTTLPRRHPPLATIAGLAAIIIGVGLGLVAYAFYPWAFSPAANWLSDLGDSFLNPQGSIFFRADMVIIGVALAAFFLGLSAWHHGQRLRFRALLGLGQFSGLVAAAAVFMTGIDPENDYAAHALWVTVLFIALASAVWFIGWAPLWHPPLPQRLPYIAVVVCAADLAALIMRRHWLEWLAVGLLICFVGAVALGAWMTAGRAAEAGPDAGRQPTRAPHFPPVPWRRHHSRS